jgi:ankyrin repeat protein
MTHLYFFGQLPLLKASQRGHCDVVKCLLSYGADINVRSKRGQSHLFVASMSGYGDVVECLLSSGANINVVIVPNCYEN